MKKIYYKDIYFAVTGNKYDAWTRKIKALAPMMYAHAISSEALRITMKSLKRAKII